MKKISVGIYENFLTIGFWNFGEDSEVRILLEQLSDKVFLRYGMEVEFEEKTSFVCLEDNNCLENDCFLFESNSLNEKEKVFNLFYELVLLTNVEVTVY